MNQSSFQATTWYYALTLTERLVSLRAIQPTTQNATVNADLAERRMQRWRSQSPFMNRCAVCAAARDRGPHRGYIAASVE